MADYIDAGKLNKAAQVLELRETAPGVWEWVPARLDLGLHHVTAENQPVFQGGHRGQERRRDRAAAAPHPPPRPPLG